MYHPDDTIAAIASAPGGAARGIVRLSGPDTLAVLERCGTFETSLPALVSASAVAGQLRLRGDHSAVLDATVYYWPTTRSYTGQIAAEIHTVGSPPLVAAVLATLREAGARLAGPGEFTLRAFLAGRLDLTQAEAVLGVIDARSDAELGHALTQLAGGVGRPLHELRDALLELLAHLEAGLDFVEEDIEFVSRAELAAQLAAAAGLVGDTLRQLSDRGRADALPRVALVGWPNVGKSSLFNALAGDGRALVSDQAGTTRDYVTATVDLAGVRCQLVDTAGREFVADQDAIDGRAQQLSAEAAAHCDIELLCLDSTRRPNAWELERLAHSGQVPRLVILTKVDSAEAWRPTALPHPTLAQAIATSAHQTGGTDRLRASLKAELEDLAASSSHGTLTAERCGESLRNAQAALERASLLNAREQGEELIAAELRLALGELGKVVGAIYSDDILDRVFSRFCIGK